MLKNIAIILFVFVSSYVLASGNISTRQVHHQSRDAQAPNFTLPMARGGMKTFSDVRAGKKTILFFWATWCPHCHDGLQQVNDQIDNLKKKDINLVMVDLGETREDVVSFMNASQMDLDSFIDTDGILQDLYEIRGVPTFYFIDEKGFIRNMTHALPENYDEYFLSKLN